MTVFVDNVYALHWPIQLCFYVVSLYVQACGHLTMRQWAEGSNSPASKTLFEDLEQPATHVFKYTLGLCHISMRMPDCIVQWAAPKKLHKELASHSMNFIAALSSAAYVRVVREGWQRVPKAQGIFKRRWAHVPYFAWIGEWDVVGLYQFVLLWSFLIHSCYLALFSVSKNAGGATFSANLLFLGHVIDDRRAACHRARDEETHYLMYKIRHVLAYSTKGLLLWVKLSLTGIIFDAIQTPADIATTAQAILVGFSALAPLLWKDLTTCSLAKAQHLVIGAPIMTILFSHAIGLLICPSHDFQLSYFRCSE